MPRGPLNPLVRYLGKLAGTPAGSRLTDADLLQRFVRERDESAFALLVERHGRLVWAVCRRVLAHEEDVEDAYQATLLVLARRAGSIRRQRSVASFLYGVAYRTALKTRTTIARRQKHERQAEARPPRGPEAEAAMRELQAVLDEEVSRLPEKFRAPFVLCCLEGKGKAEAAEELGWPEGTVSGRVAQARQLLQRRLARRGITLTAALCALAAAAEGVASAITTAAVVKAALPFAAGQALAAGTVSARAVVIAEAVLRAGTTGRLRLLFVGVVLLGLAGGGAGAWLRHAALDHSSDPVSADDLATTPVRDDRAAAADPARPGGEADRPVTIAGRVVGPDGQPLRGARVAVSAARRARPGKRDLEAPFRQSTLSAGSADNQGGFRLSLPPGAQQNGLTVLASHQGYGLAWRTVLDPGQADVPLRLDPGQSARGRLVDSRGAPVRGVTVHVAGVAKQASGGELLQFPDPPENLPPWFPPVVTDDQGEFILRDLGPDWTVYLTVRDDRFAFQPLTVKTGPREKAEPLTFTLAPAQLLEGQVTGEDTGAPLAGVVLVAGGAAADPGSLTRARTRTDAQGRFRLNPSPGGPLTVSVYPPEGTSYLGLQLPLPWPRKQPGERAHFSLPRGVRVRGRVVEAGSGRPLAGAVVTAMARIPGNRYLRRTNPNEGIQFQEEVATAADGSYEMTVLPGPGHLLVVGPTPDYLHVETTDLRLLYDRPGGNPYYPHGLLPVDLPPGDGVHALEPVVLRRGVTLGGNLVGPDGRPAGPGFLLCPTCIPQGYLFDGTTLPTRAGRFDLPGCDPGRAVTVWFFDPHDGLGGVEQLSPRPDGEPVVRLAACGSATVRLVPAPGTKAPASVGAELALALRLPGAAPATPGRLVPAYVFRGSGLAAVDQREHRLTFRQLIPGAVYVLRVDTGGGWANLKEFTVRPGQHLDLGDVMFRPPPGAGRAPVKT
jgi:RNA polymerase sigma factor (sigma-70 family)